MKAKALVIITPGFAANEADTTCLPPRQMFVKVLHKAYRRHLALTGLISLIKFPSKFDMQLLKKAVSIIYYLPVAWLQKVKLALTERMVA